VLPSDVFGSVFDDQAETETPAEKIADITAEPAQSDGQTSDTVEPAPQVESVDHDVANDHVTRIYFDDEAANAADPVLALVPADRRATLLAKRKAGAANPAYVLDIHLQGDNETVFFDV
jgi:protocatechuate 3,4-dioxygenase beta subunit